MKTIRSFSNVAEANFAQSLLVSVGIDASLADEAAYTMEPPLVPWGIRLQVPDSEVARALETLDSQAEFAPLADDFVPPEEAQEIAPTEAESRFGTFLASGFWMLIALAVLALVGFSLGGEIHLGRDAVVIIFCLGGVLGVFVGDLSNMKSFLQLDPASLAARARTELHPRIPSLATSLFIGIGGFTFVSVAGFVPWAVFGHTLHRLIGEAGLYATCAAVFIGLSGVAMHRLIIGPESLGRFYKLFSIAFAAYAVLWIAGFMTLRGQPGGVVGLLAGTLAMGLVLTHTFEARGKAVAVVASLFLLNAAGYFIGGMCEAALTPVNGLASRLSWGLCYGIGFGAGLGLAFYLCQAEARRLLAQTE